MKVFTSAIRLKTVNKTAEVNITDQVEAVVHESGIQEGMALVHTGHTTAAIHMNNPDSDLEADFHDCLNTLM
jgi:thiamine phosphate synthase YjbQ (UPF0047 family)